MKKQIPLFFLLLSLLMIQSCTKDRVPNPDTLNIAQTLIYDQNFDGSVSNLPSGWTVAGGSGGWAVDTSNSSYPATDVPPAYTGGGYAGATGNSNLDISNFTVGANATYTVTSAPLSTVGYTNIGINYGARNSKHFADDGSTVTLAWSTDGVTWNNLEYQQDLNDSNWHLVNNGGRISLPAGAANQPTLYFQWTANLVATASGSYRIDDVQVYGTP